MKGQEYMKSRVLGVSSRKNRMCYMENDAFFLNFTQRIIKHYEFAPWRHAKLPVIKAVGEARSGG